MAEVYTTMQVVARTGATYRQADYWSRTGLCMASVVEAGGSGTQRLYSADDLWRVAVCKALLDGGLSLTAVREVLDTACEHGAVMLTDKVAIQLDVDRLRQKLQVEPRTGLQLVRS